MPLSSLGRSCGEKSGGEIKKWKINAEKADLWKVPEEVTTGLLRF